MKLRNVCLIVLIVAPFTLHPASSDALRGFDSASQAEELKWEEQARAIPEASRIRTLIEKMANQAHMAGTPQSKQTAEYILAQLKEYGLDAHIEQYESMLPQPRSRSLEMTAPISFKAKLDEPPVAGDKNSSDPGMVPSYHAFSGDGDVTAPLVYVNYGVPADYEILKQQGIDVKGKIVIARYGNSFRGIKPKVAYEHGALGCLVYSDPKDDGYFQGDVYPKGAYRPPDGVQRGSVIDLGTAPGDPLSPGWASEPGSKRLPISEAATLMKIPVIPISYADAQPLLQNLGGPVAPEAWRGALPITYHLGPGLARVHLAVSMDNATRPLYDVIATIPGSEFPDQWILEGNHHDAWVHGASDPLSGAAPLLETARSLAELTRKGWKPKRTIMLAFWDGEEFGLIGSTEYMEKHQEELSRKLAVYLNSDSSGKGRLRIGGSHTLEAFSQEVVRDIKDPASGKSLLEEILSHPPRSRPGTDVETPTPPTEFRISPLGSGSDYTPFLQHLGIATLNVGFSGDDSDTGVYHSNYDDFYWYSHFSDTGFVYGRALAQVDSTIVMRLADAPLLPFQFERFAATVGRYVDEIDHLPGRGIRPDLSKVRAEIQRLNRSSAAFESEWTQVLLKPPSPANAAKLAAINQTLFRSERDLILDPGLPGRPWYRHRIYAPGLYTGYAVKTLPGIREAVEARKPAEAEQQAAQVAQVLKAIADHVDQAAKLLSGL